MSGTGDEIRRLALGLLLLLFTGLILLFLPLVRLALMTGLMLLLLFSPVGLILVLLVSWIFLLSVHMITSSS